MADLEREREFVCALERDRETERQRQRDRDRERQRDRETERERRRDRERDREKECFNKVNVRYVVFKTCLFTRKVFRKHFERRSYSLKVGLINRNIFSFCHETSATVLFC